MREEEPTGPKRTGRQLRVGLGWWCGVWWVAVDTIRW